MEHRNGEKSLWNLILILQNQALRPTDNSTHFRSERVGDKTLNRFVEKYIVLL